MRESNLFLIALPLVVAACNDGQRVPLGEQHSLFGGASGIPATGGATSMPVTGGSTSMPVTGGSTSMPVTGGSTSMPATGGSTSMPVTGGSTSMPVTGGSTSMPAAGGSSNTVPTSSPCNVLTQVCNLTLDVKSYLNACLGEGVFSCMLARTNDTGAYQFLSSAIQGFTFEWGYEYRLKIETTPVPNPPADGSSVAYRLLEIVSKTPVAAGTEFELALAPLVNTAEELGSVFSGDCTAGYTLFGKSLNFDASMSCESFRAITAATIPNAVKLRFSTPEGPLSVIGTTPTLQYLEIDPDLHGCLGYGGPAPLPCKWTRTNGSGEFKGLWETINGFEFQWGYDYGLVVKVTNIPDPPIDGSSYEYTLVRLVNKTPVIAGTEFEFDLSGYKLGSLQYAVPGSCSLGYKLLATNGPDLAFDAGMTCETFAAMLATSLPQSITLKFSNPGGPLSVVSVQARLDP